MSGITMILVIAIPLIESYFNCAKHLVYNISFNSPKALWDE